VLRSIPLNVPDFAKLGLPKVLEKLAQEERGLILVTGVTGSGKSSTLAAMVNYINQHYRKHIVTIEDPIEFVHEDNFSRVMQREVGPDTPSFAAALRAALRQDPDVILVGEMRDARRSRSRSRPPRPGHLVLSTVHTQDATRTIGRIIGVFPPRVRRACATASPRTCGHHVTAPAAARLGRGRAVAAEIMVSTLSVVEFIKDPNRTHEITDYLERTRPARHPELRHAPRGAAQGGQITRETALEAASNRADFERALAFE
jgi:twitching motility protein PilT